MESGPKETTAVEQPKQGVANPLAFPFDDNDKGMTLRDYFAAKALSSSFFELTEFTDQEYVGQCRKFAKDCYIMADAMLKARLE